MDSPDQIHAHDVAPIVPVPPPSQAQTISPSQSTPISTPQAPSEPTPQSTYEDKWPRKFSTTREDEFALKSIRRDAWEKEQAILPSLVSVSAQPLDPASLAPCTFELANGHGVRIEFGKFWERAAWDHSGPSAIIKDFFFRVYSTEDTFPKNFTFQWEFRADKEFNLEAVTKIWDWLSDLAETREFLKYDSLEEFIEEFEATITELSAAGEDAVEHFEHLPELYIPEWFDRVDDSLFNDQNDSGSESREDDNHSQ